MFSGKNCLKRKKDFSYVFKKGKGLKEGLLYLKFVPNDLQETRFGIVISQKVSKKAVLRNKIKRRIKSAIKHRLPGIKKGIDAVLVASPGMESKNFQEIENMTDKILKRARIIVSQRTGR